MDPRTTIIVLLIIIAMFCALIAALLINQKRSNEAMKNMLKNKESNFQSMLTQVYGEYGSVPTMERQGP